MPKVPSLPDEYRVAYNHPVKDQGEVGKCTIETVAYNGEMGEEKLTSKYTEMSTDMLYAHRDASDWQGEGTEPREVWKHWLHDGNCPAVFFGLLNIEYPANTVLFNKIRYKLFRLAYKHRLKAYYALTNDEEIKQALYKGLKVMLAIPVFRSFIESFTNGHVPIPENASTILNPDYIGDHAITYMGWAKDNEKVFLNSWGETYGDKGYGYLPIGYPVNEAWAFEFGAKFNIFVYVWLWIKQIIHLQF
jgi:hypothetical protein